MTAWPLLKAWQSLLLALGKTEPTIGTAEGWTSRDLVAGTLSGGLDHCVLLAVTLLRGIF